MKLETKTWVLWPVAILCYIAITCALVGVAWHFISKYS